MDDLDDPLTKALSSRRIPHGRSKNSTRRGGDYAQASTGSRTGFDPLRALGYYEVYAGSKKGAQRARRGGSGDGGRGGGSWMEIHELTEAENGFIGTFGITFDGAGVVPKQRKKKRKDKEESDVAETIGGRIEGMFVLAGSRKVLQSIVEGLDREADSRTETDIQQEEEEEEEEDESAIDSKADTAHSDEGDNDNTDEKRETVGSEIEGEDEACYAGPESGDSKNYDSTDTENHTAQPTNATIDTIDSDQQTRYTAFEKNTFRNPKFWLRYQAHVHPSLSSTTNSDSAAPPVKPESNMGYVVFNSNSCDRFEGTISCNLLGWDNLRIMGWKTRPQGSKHCVSWGDLNH